MPIVIHFAYSVEKSRITTTWESADFLLYCGTVFGGIMTLLAVYISISAMNEERLSQNKEKVRVLLDVENL